MDSVRLFVRCALKRSTVLRALGVAAVITPILVGVNQWDRMASGALDVRFLVKVALTFCVPYLVSTYSSARAESVQYRKDRRASASDRQDQALPERS